MVEAAGVPSLVCVFKAGAAPPAVAFFFSSPEVRIRHVSQSAVGLRISPVGVFVTDALCRLSPAGRSALLRHGRIRQPEIFFLPPTVQLLLFWPFIPEAFPLLTIFKSFFFVR